MTSRSASLLVWVLGWTLACATTPEPEKIAPGTPPAPPAPPAPACEPCIAMLDTPIDELPDGCGIPDGATCDDLDRLRNCMYARLGYDFSDNPSWREVFEKEPWYTPDPAFRWEDVTRVQKRNAQILWDRVERRRCARP
ncbi:MAG: YARHG domain-containing protein [Alphaproteobacteria bacterium]|nr:YARHG domain-containing protein [Alphaproteobacteria bacterium]MCB9699270.1 YARHG domain-containing protein [Alphaproteobacteria bacterium]